MTTRRQETTVLDSMFSCFPTNQRVGSYTNTRLSKFDKILCQDSLISQRVLWNLLWESSVSSSLQSRRSISATLIISPAILGSGCRHNLLQNFQVSSLRFYLHVREFRVINQSAQFRWVGQHHLLSSTSSALTSLSLLMDDYVFASGCFRHCRLVISPSRLTYYTNADEHLSHYHCLLHCYWLDHRHRHLHQHHVKPLQHSLLCCCWWATSSS